MIVTIYHNSGNSDIHDYEYYHDNWLVYSHNYHDGSGHDSWLLFHQMYYPIKFL